MTTASKDATVAPWEEPQDATTSSNADSNQIEAFAEFADFSAPDDDPEAVPDDAPVPPEKEPLIDEIASEFVGFWNLLVSKTNWEKGKVIHSWRVKLIEAGLPRRIYSDDSLAQRIGNVSPQHVGRLRRVYERFGSAPTLPNLYWSHYQAALDWEDADEWLKKASDEKLSVAQTRVARWEKNGAPLNHKPKDSDIVVSERDEDVNPANDSNADFAPPSSVERDDTVTAKQGEIVDPESEKKSKKKKDAKENKQGDELGEFSGEAEPWEAAQETIRTADVLDAFKKLDSLPQDFAEPFEALKLAIVWRKQDNWQDVKPIQIAAYLSELKKLLVSEG